MILPCGDYMAATLIRYSMQALDDELGINPAGPHTKQLRDIFFAIRNRSEDAHYRLQCSDAISVAQLPEAEPSE